MLFNSYAFICVFLPATLIGFFVLARAGKLWATCWLVLASLLFYAYWNPRYLPLLLGSIVFNYAAGRLLIRNAAGTRPLNKSAILAVAIGSNLLLLAYYKYAGFFVENTEAVLGLDWSIPHIVLPLGISFFTFTQIAYLVDVYRGTAREARFIHYALFVSYFPHLIAGPILHHSEMMPQFTRDDVYSWDSDRFVNGMVVFTIGLVKKVVLADGVAAFVGPAFQAVGLGHAPSLVEAWGAAFAYTFQLYFDFSGYCDMAIGASWLFGIGLPLNFNSPYKAANIIDFWRRWHITLSRFLRDYLYIPLGGNRRGSIRRYVNLLATMVIGGLWHGAGWTFVIWGGLHGLYLVINHAWAAMRSRIELPTLGRAGAILSWAITFLAVVVGWVFFRAPSLQDALHMVVGMSGANGLGLDRSAASLTEVYWTWAWCVGLGAIAFILPNTEEIMAPYLPQIAKPAGTSGPIRWAALTFSPSLGWAAVTAVLLAAGLISLPQPTNFLYFNF